jgi:hypothetical protein
MHSEGIGGWRIAVGFSVFVQKDQSSRTRVAVTPVLGGTNIMARIQI